MSDTRKKPTNRPNDLIFALALMFGGFVLIAVWQIWIFGVIAAAMGFVYLIVWLIRSGRRA